MKGIIIIILILSVIIILGIFVYKYINKREQFTVTNTPECQYINAATAIPIASTLPTDADVNSIKTTVTDSVTDYLNNLAAKIKCIITRSVMSLDKVDSEGKKVSDCIGDCMKCKSNDTKCLVKYPCDDFKQKTFMCKNENATPANTICMTQWVLKTDKTWGRQDPASAHALDIYTDYDAYIYKDIGEYISQGKGPGSNTCSYRGGASLICLPHETPNSYPDCTDGCGGAGSLNPPALSKPFDIIYNNDLSIDPVKSGDPNDNNRILIKGTFKIINLCFCLAIKLWTTQPDQFATKLYYIYNVFLQPQTINLNNIAVDVFISRDTAKFISVKINGKDPNQFVTDLLKDIKPVPQLLIRTTPSLSPSGIATIAAGTVLSIFTFGLAASLAGGTLGAALALLIQQGQGISLNVNDIILKQIDDQIPGALKGALSTAGAGIAPFNIESAIYEQISLILKQRTTCNYIMEQMFNGTQITKWISIKFITENHKDIGVDMDPITHIDNMFKISFNYSENISLQIKIGNNTKEEQLINKTTKFVFSIYICRWDNDWVEDLTNKLRVSATFDLVPANNTNLTLLEKILSNNKPSSNDLGQNISDDIWKLFHNQLNNYLTTSLNSLLYEYITIILPLYFRPHKNKDGTCENKWKGYMCQYTDDQCNGGTIDNFGNCTCLPHYGGRQCQCGAKCGNNGISDDSCSFCICDTGYSGPNCDNICITNGNDAKIVGFANPNDPSKPPTWVCYDCCENENISRFAVKDNINNPCVYRCLDNDTLLEYIQNGKNEKWPILCPIQSVDDNDPVGHVCGPEQCCSLLKNAEAKIQKLDKDSPTINTDTNSDVQFYGDGWKITATTSDSGVHCKEITKDDGEKIYNGKLKVKGICNYTCPTGRYYLDPKDNPANTLTSAKVTYWCNISEDLSNIYSKYSCNLCHSLHIFNNTKPFRIRNISSDNNLLYKDQNYLCSLIKSGTSSRTLVMNDPLLSRSISFSDVYSCDVSDDNNYIQSLSTGIFKYENNLLYEYIYIVDNDNNINKKWYCVNINNFSELEQCSSNTNISAHNSRGTISSSSNFLTGINNELKITDKTPTPTWDFENIIDIDKLDIPLKFKLYTLSLNRYPFVGSHDSATGDSWLKSVVPTVQTQTKSTLAQYNSCGIRFFDLQITTNKDKNLQFYKNIPLKLLNDDSYFKDMLKQAVNDKEIIILYITLVSGLVTADFNTKFTTFLKALDIADNTVILKDPNELEKPYGYYVTNNKYIIVVPNNPTFGDNNSPDATSTLPPHNIYKQYPNKCFTFDTVDLGNNAISSWKSGGDKITKIKNLGKAIYNDKDNRMSLIENAVRNGDVFNKDDCLAMSCLDNQHHSWKSTGIAKAGGYKGIYDYLDYSSPKTYNNKLSITEAFFKPQIDGTSVFKEVLGGFETIVESGCLRSFDTANPFNGEPVMTERITKLNSKVLEYFKKNKTIPNIILFDNVGKDTFELANLLKKRVNNLF